MLYGGPDMFQFRPSLRTLAVLIPLSLWPGPAPAQTPEVLGNAGKWSAYTFLEEGKTVCYMSSEPDKQEGNYKVRDKAYALVTHRPALNSRDVVSFIAGYPLKPDLDVTVVIDGRHRFLLFPSAETAWARDEKTDRSMVDAMIKGTSMVVNGVSARGTKTVDTYSLAGFTQIYRTISRACGVKD